MPPEIDDLNDWMVDEWPSTPDGEERQADEISRHFTTLFSHPAVEAVTYWGFADGQMWLGAPGGFLREDGSKKPAYDALQSLVRDQWWTPPQTLRTDDTGLLHLDGFAGRYSVAAASGAVEVELGPGNAVAEAQLVVE